MDSDFLVIGAGVAGLRAAIELAEAGQVLVVAKESLQESASEYAQGGIAAALADDDEIGLHEHDTIYAGDGLCDRAAVQALVGDGPAAIEQLIEWGAEFDREGSRLAFGREGAHSRSRILHAHGDSTGREIARVLYHKASSLENVTFRSYAAVTDLLIDDGRVCGAVVYENAASEPRRIYAPLVLLATGGLGQAFGRTTNPVVATGDGVAMSYRAGAEIGDIEFVQFHPTALAVDNAPHFLISEALRGEGAALVNSSGERFMTRVHPMGDLAPRDVVARAIIAEMSRTGGAVYLDLTAKGEAFARERFPRIHATCLAYGVDIGRQPIPVAPAAHYAMGGVRTGLDGRTTVDRLFAAGEVASTGVHGANRLASNSLLEGVVFGARAGKAMREAPAISGSRAGNPPGCRLPAAGVAEIQRLVWEHCGIIREGGKLEAACDRLQRDAPGKAETPDGLTARNLRDVALLIARAALARRESRGAHYRSDYPTKSAEFEKHSIAIRGREIEFRTKDPAGGGAIVS
jgi:L-aspartate oxidase